MSDAHLRAVLTYQREHRRRGLGILCSRTAAPSPFCRRHQRGRGGTKRWGPAAATVAWVAALAFLLGKGLSYREIAEVCGVSPPAIAARLTSFRRRGWLPPGLTSPRAAHFATRGARAARA